MAKKRIKKRSNNSELPALRKEDKEKSKKFIYLLFFIFTFLALIIVALQSM